MSCLERQLLSPCEDLGCYCGELVEGSKAKRDMI